LLQVDSSALSPGLPGSLEIKTTQRWEVPDASNSKPLSISEGRGSLVFFNPASFFRFPMTGLQYMSDAASPEERANLNLDFASWVEWLYRGN
jgi:hypothetical protein